MKYAPYLELWLLQSKTVSHEKQTSPARMYRYSVVFWSDLNKIKSKEDVVFPFTDTKQKLKELIKSYTHVFNFTKK